MNRLATVGLFSVPQAFEPEYSRGQVAAHTGTDPDLDWQLVVILRRKASELISQAAAEGEPLGPEDRRLQGRSIIRRVVRDHVETLSSTGEALWPVEVEAACARAVENAIFGYGRLQPLFEIPEAENIEIHGCDSVVVQYSDGHRENRPPVADSDEELVEAIRFLGESVSPARPFDDTHPMLTLGRLRIRLTSGSPHSAASLPLVEPAPSPLGCAAPHTDVAGRKNSATSNQAQLTQIRISPCPVRKRRWGTCTRSTAMSPKTRRLSVRSDTGPVAAFLLAPTTPRRGQLCRV